MGRKPSLFSRRIWPPDDYGSTALTLTISLTNQVTGQHMTERKRAMNTTTTNRPGRGAVGRRVQAVAAAAGAAVFLAMGAFGITAHGNDANANVVEATAPTTVQRPARGQPETPFAKPTITAPPFGGWCATCSSNAGLLN